MSAVVKLGSRLPGDFETNGLDGIVDDLINDPKTPRMGIVVFDIDEIKDNTDTGDRIPRVRIRRFEPAGPSGAVFDLLKEKFLELSETRTGKTALPYDVVDVVEQGSLKGDDEF